MRYYFALPVLEVLATHTELFPYTNLVSPLLKCMLTHSCAGCGWWPSGIERIWCSVAARGAWFSPLMCHLYYAACNNSFLLGGSCLPCCVWMLFCPWCIMCVLLRVNALLSLLHHVCHAACECSLFLGASCLPCCMWMLFCPWCVVHVLLQVRLFHSLSCHSLSCLSLSCHSLSCLSLSCHSLNWHSLSCHSLSWQRCCLGPYNPALDVRSVWLRAPIFAV